MINNKTNTTDFSGDNRNHYIFTPIGNHKLEQFNKGVLENYGMCFYILFALFILININYIKVTDFQMPDILFFIIAVFIIIINIISHNSILKAAIIGSQTLIFNTGVKEYIFSINYIVSIYVYTLSSSGLSYILLKINHPNHKRKLYFFEISTHFNEKNIVDLRDQFYTELSAKTKFKHVI